MDNLQSQPVLSCTGLVKRYGGRVALSGISFTAGNGRILGLLGPNGSGKTTLIKLVAGLLVPDEGGVFLYGNKPGIVSKQFVSYLPDRNFLDGDMTFLQACEMFRSFFDDFEEQRAMYLLNDLGIDPKQRFKTLSKGNREKAQLILVMSRRAYLYLLDEPIAGVDPATRDYILNTIIANRNPHSTVIVSTHLIRDVEPVLDDVLFIKNGQIALYDSVEHVRQESGKSVDEVFRGIFAYQSGSAPQQMREVQ